MSEQTEVRKVVKVTKKKKKVTIEGDVQQEERSSIDMGTDKEVRCHIQDR